MANDSDRMDYIGIGSGFFLRNMLNIKLIFVDITCNMLDKLRNIGYAWYRAY